MCFNLIEWVFVLFEGGLVPGVLKIENITALFIIFIDVILSRFEINFDLFKHCDLNSVELD